MKEIAVHQLVSEFAEGDAISREAIAIRDICRGLGFPSNIYAPAERIAPELAADAQPLDRFSAPRDTDVVLYHYSVESPATEQFLESPARRVLIYHNITPAEFYVPFDRAAATQLEQARLRLRETALRADAVWAASAFNASELEAMDVTHVKVFPLLFSPAPLDIPPDRAAIESFSGPAKNILFVGRIAPNKCVEELIGAFAWYHRRINPDSRLIIVGSDRTTPAYFAMLRMYAGDLDLDDVCFQRFATPAGLTACYGKADLFVTASRHEGYCLPLVEAMYKGVPVIARHVGGIPEALNGAGIMYEDLRPEELGELFHLALSDDTVRDELRASQQARIREILDRPIQKEFLSLLSDLVPVM